MALGLSSGSGFLGLSQGLRVLYKRGGWDFMPVPQWHPACLHHQGGSFLALCPAPRLPVSTWQELLEKGSQVTADVPGVWGSLLF